MMKEVEGNIQTDRKLSNEVQEILELNEIFYSISKMIIEYRKEHEITQTELAKILNVNQTMISKIESGKYNPTVKQIYKISRKLTGHADMFKDTLREILRNLEEVECVINAYLKEDNNSVEYSYTEIYNNSKDNNKVIYINEYYINNKGEMENGKYESKYTING